MRVSSCGRDLPQESPWDLRAAPVAPRGPPWPLLLSPPLLRVSLIAFKHGLFLVVFTIFRPPHHEPLPGRGPVIVDDFERSLPRPYGAAHAVLRGRTRETRNGKQKAIFNGRNEARLRTSSFNKLCASTLVV